MPLHLQKPADQQTESKDCQADQHHRRRLGQNKTDTQHPVQDNRVGQVDAERIAPDISQEPQAEEREQTDREAVEQDARVHGYHDAVGEAVEVVPVSAVIGEQVEVAEVHCH